MSLSNTVSYILEAGGFINRFIFIQNICVICSFAFSKTVCYRHGGYTAVFWQSPTVTVHRGSDVTGGKCLV